jgi:hypothetical protein
MLMYGFGVSGTRYQYVEAFQMFLQTMHLPSSGLMTLRLRMHCGRPLDLRVLPGYSDAGFLSRF